LPVRSARRNPGLRRGRNGRRRWRALRHLARPAGRHRLLLPRRTGPSGPTPPAAVVCLA